ncbi:MAG: hypothetical protein ACJ76J_30635 [Thermoanaerobaculia bacterium]
MTSAVVLDTDFLSAFLKIGRLALVRDFYGADSLLVPSAVLHEVSSTPLFAELNQLPWIRVVTPESSPPALQGLGAGEREAIGLAQQVKTLVLTNDNQARRAAQRIGVAAVDIPSFLLSCKSSGFLSREGIGEVVNALMEKDRYGFRKEVLDRLLS